MLGLLALLRQACVPPMHSFPSNSASGHNVGPRPEARFYAGTKHMVTALTEGLRQELRQTDTHIRISVSCVCVCVCVCVCQSVVDLLLATL